MNRFEMKKLNFNFKKSHLIITLIVFIAGACLVSGYYFYKKSNEFKISDENKQLIQQTAQDMSQCAGYMDAWSWYSEKLGMEETAKTFKDSYRGWYMASAYLLYSTGVYPKWKGATAYAEGLANTSSQNFKSGLEVDEKTNSQENVQEMDTFFDDKCKPLADYQSTLVMQMREIIAQAESSE
jgi:hypothetical protein